MSGFLKNIFVTRSNPEVVENIYEFVKGDVGEAETSLISEEFLPDCVPAGLYCVIDDFECTAWEVAVPHGESVSPPWFLLE